MKLPSFAESFIVKMAISKSGPLVMKATTGVVAAVVALIAQKVPGIEVYLNEYVLTGILWVGIDYAYGLIPESIKKKYGKEMQEILNQNGANVTIDGYVGPETLKAVSEKIKPIK
jgi:hypothetical protein